MTVIATNDDALLTLAPDRTVNARETFDVDFDMDVPAFSERDAHVPDIDDAYKFDPETTRAICAGFAYNRRVMVQASRPTSSRWRRG